MFRKIIKSALIALTTTTAVAIPLATAGPANAVGPSTPVILEFTASPNPFWPTVRDGYKDGVKFSGRSDKLPTPADQSWQIVVRNSSGGKVAERAGLHPHWGDGIGWSWNGKDLNGNPVTAGTYTATFIVTNLETGQRATAAQTLTAKSSTNYKRITRSHEGVDTSYRSRSADCYIRRDSFDPGSLELDCWGGYQAVARYGFSLPSNATNLTWKVAGERGCCDNGLVQKTAWRTGNHFDVQVRVTDWAMYTVDRASVIYTITVRR